MQEFIFILHNNNIMETEKIPGPLECAEDLYMKAWALRESLNRFKEFSPFLHISTPYNGQNIDTLTNIIISSLSNLNLDIKKG